VDGIERLRHTRGGEHVTFSDVADHLDDYVARRPVDADAIERLARFLAGVEDVEHEHDGAGLTVPPAEPVPAPMEGGRDG
jgi:hypothetical protein